MVKKTIIILFFMGVLCWLGRDYLVRGYKNITGSFERQKAIESLAGCQVRTMVDQLSDEGFSEYWEDAKKLSFDAIDVDRYMKSHCPLQSDEEIEQANRKYKESYEKETGNHLNENENTSSIEREKNMAAYQRKFINREFTALKK